MSRKQFIFLVVLIIVVIALVVAFAWMRFGAPAGEGGLWMFGGGGSGGILSGSPTGGESSGGAATPPSELAQITLPRLIQLTQEAVTGATAVRGEKKVKYFKRATGHLYQIDEEARAPEERISNLTIPGAREAFWSQNGNHAVVTFIDEDILKHFSLTYQATSSKGVFLPPDIRAIAFSPKEERMAYLLLTGSVNTLFTASSDGSGQKEIFSTPLRELSLGWAGDTISLAVRGSGLAPSLVALVSQKGSERIILDGNEGLDIVWNSAGNKAIVSRTTLRGRTLETLIVDTDGVVVAGLPFATIAGKCAWSHLEEDLLYCAVPRSLPRATYPDAWWQGSVKFSDNMWRANLATGETDIVFDERDFDITEIFLSEVEDRLFFLNKDDSVLWSLRLE